MPNKEKEQLNKKAALLSEGEIEIIAKNNVAIAKKEKEILLEEERAKHDAWLKERGYKEFANKKGICKKLRRRINDIKVFFNILFVRKSKIEGEKATSTLLQTMVIMLFKALFYLLWLCAIYLIFFSQIGAISGGVFSYKECLFTALLGIVAIIFAQLFRMASIEVENSKDRNYVVDIFVAVMTVIAVLVAIFKG